MYICMENICTYVYRYVYIYIERERETYAHAYIYIYIHMCIYTYIYIFLNVAGRGLLRIEYTKGPWRCMEVVRRFSRIL